MLAGKLHSPKLDASQALNLSAASASFSWTRRQLSSGATGALGLHCRPNTSRNPFEGRPIPPSGTARFLTHRAPRKISASSAPASFELATASLSSGIEIVLGNPVTGHADQGQISTKPDRGDSLSCWLRHPGQGIPSLWHTAACNSCWWKSFEDKRARKLSCITHAKYCSRGLKPRPKPSGLA